MPDGPAKMNEPEGRFGSFNPVRVRRIALDTAWTGFCGGLRPGEGEAEDAIPDACGLVSQRAGVVREVEPLAEVTYPWGDLGIPIAGQVGEQVVFDLVTQVP